MIILHALFAVLAAWRITELVVSPQDEIFEPLRRWWKRVFANRPRLLVFITCSRCVSVWTSGLVTLAFIFVPFLNWPFALSMTFGMYGIVLNRSSYGGQRKIVVMPDVHRIDWGEYGPEEGKRLMREAFAEPVGRNGGR